MIKLKRTDSDDKDFNLLVNYLDDELTMVDGDDHVFYSQFNKTDKIHHVVVAYFYDIPAGCGALKEYREGTMEVKRMYVFPHSRNKGLATLVLKELEKWAVELKCQRIILETGKRQPDAVRLYEKNGYKRIPNYDQYEGVENSLCFAKDLE